MVIFADAEFRHRMNRGNMHQHFGLPRTNPEFEHEYQSTLDWENTILGVGMNHRQEYRGHPLSTFASHPISTFASFNQPQPAIPQSMHSMAFTFPDPLPPYAQASSSALPQTHWALDPIFSSGGRDRIPGDDPFGYHASPSI